MKRIFLFVAVAAAALSLGGCQRGGGGNAEPMNFKKLTNGKAVYRGEEAGLRHYAVTLWTNGHSTAAAAFAKFPFRIVRYYSVRVIARCDAVISGTWRQMACSGF